MSLQVVGLPDWPVSARFSPSPPSPAAHQPRNNSSSDLKAAHSRQAVTGAKSKAALERVPNLNGAKPSLPPAAQFLVDYDLGLLGIKCEPW